MSSTILTDAKGKPLDRPEAPEPGSGIDATISFLRAMHAYNDAVGDAACRGFEKGLRKITKP